MSFWFSEIQGEGIWSVTLWCTTTKQKTRHQILICRPKWTKKRKLNSTIIIIFSIEGKISFSELITVFFRKHKFVWHESDMTVKKEPSLMDNYEWDAMNMKYKFKPGREAIANVRNKENTCAVMWCHVWQNWVSLSTCLQNVSKFQNFLFVDRSPLSLQYYSLRNFRKSGPNFDQNKQILTDLHAHTSLCSLIIFKDSKMSSQTKADLASWAYFQTNKNPTASFIVHRITLFT